MPSAEPASSMQWRFSDIVPSVDAQHCLNTRHKAAACTRCAAACPVQAITVMEGTPWLEPARCVGCGVCQVACPTDVFRQASAPEAKLVQTVSQTPAVASVSLVCPLRATPELTVAPVDLVVRHRRCLAALSIADLLALVQADGRSVWLDDSPCEPCPLAKAQRTLHASVATAQALLEAMDSLSSIELHSRHPELAVAKPERRPLLDGMQPKISRRRLFGLTPATAHEPSMTSDGGETLPGDNRAKPIGRQLPQRVPPSHLLLLDRLRQMSSDGDRLLTADSTPFADIEIDVQACSACGLCAYFCPTNALQFDAEGQEFAVWFRADRCIGCGLCKVACPEDAIHFGETVTVERLLAQEEHVLAEGGLAPCTVCGVDTAVHGEQHLCHSCRHGAGTVQPLRDDAGLMADLLSRITPLSQSG